MRYLPTTITGLSLIAAISVIVFGVVQISEIVAEETDDNEYVFAEDVKITGEFIFHKGIEVNEFTVYKQKSGFDHTRKATFTLEKVSNGTPLLYAAADEAHRKNKNSFPSNDFVDFKTKIILSRGGDLIRVFEYEECEITDYSVSTEHDKEEGYVSSSKGFAVVDEFEITCLGYEPINPQYEKIMKDQKKSTIPNPGSEEENNLG